jgi:TetR/AcrR family transcriptional regulator
MDRSSQPPRRQREQLRRREEILDAALRVFAIRGYDGTTMAEISRTAEYPLATIYKIFPSKEKIYLELVDSYVRQLEERLVAAVKLIDRSPLERLESCARIKAEFFQQNKDYLKVFLAEHGQIELAMLPGTRATEEPWQALEHTYQRMTDLYADLFAEGIANGDFKPLPPRDLGVLYLAMTNAMAWQWLVADTEQRNLGDQMQYVLKILSGGICRHE